MYIFLKFSFGKFSNLIFYIYFLQNVVRKVERQYMEIAGTASESLRVNSTTVESYLRKFEWDFARYQYSGRSLGDLVSQIQANANKVDEELKKLASNFTDKNLQLSTLQRKKVINLYSSDFEDFLIPEQVARLEILRADTVEKVLETVMIVFSKSLEPGNFNIYYYMSLISSGLIIFSSFLTEFLRTYETIGKDIVTFEDGKGTPIVPGSQKKVFEDNDNVMYSVVILTSHYQKGSYEGDTFIAGNNNT